MSAARLHKTAAKHLLVKLDQSNVATVRATTRVQFFPICEAYSQLNFNFNMTGWKRLYTFKMWTALIALKTILSHLTEWPRWPRLAVSFGGREGGGAFPHFVAQVSNAQIFSSITSNFILKFEGLPHILALRWDPYLAPTCPLPCHLCS